VYRYAVDPKGRQDGDLGYGTWYDYDNQLKPKTHLYQLYGIWHLDTRSTTSPFYETQGIHIKKGDELSIFDNPSVPIFKGYRESGFVAQTYLIVNDKPVYVINWKEVYKAGAKGAKYEVDDGKPVTDFELGFEKAAKWFIGYTDEDRTVRKFIDNPFFK
jgi:hypothetical protein